MNTVFLKTYREALSFLQSSFYFIVLTLFVITLLHNTTQAQLICPERNIVQVPM